ncbi:hypothetical protein SDC9_59110 [bioreactor metagenome]|uniref:Uncharacterized protein n=1 Tax=bioreactor metagenome TaxID=1076179 RepID=A0A644X9A1_9ZZZZ
MLLIEIHQFKFGDVFFNAFFQQSGQVLDIRLRNRRNEVKNRPAGETPRINAVHRQHMKMDVQVESIAEPLDERYSPATSGPSQIRKSGGAAEVRENRVDQNVVDSCDHFGIVSQPEPQRVRQRKHPLPDGYLRENPVHEVGSGISHAPSAAGRADAAPFAGERDHPVTAAIVAMNPQEAARVNAAFEEIAEFALDETRDRASALFLPGQEGFQIGGDRHVQGLPGGIARNVFRLAERLTGGTPIPHPFDFQSGIHLCAPVFR